MSSLP
jgi:hypothetical protein